MITCDRLSVSSTHIYPVNTKHLYNIYTMLDQRRRRWADVVYMLYKWSVLAGYVHLHSSVKPKYSNCLLEKWELIVFWYIRQLIIPTFSRLQKYCNPAIHSILIVDLYSFLSLFTSTEITVGGVVNTISSYIHWRRGSNFSICFLSVRVGNRVKTLQFLIPVAERNLTSKYSDLLHSVKKGRVVTSRL